MLKKIYTQVVLVYFQYFWCNLLLKYGHSLCGTPPPAAEKSLKPVFIDFK